MSDRPPATALEPSALQDRDLRPDAAWDGFAAGVQERTGIDLHGYRTPQMERRLRGELQQAGAGHYGEYLQLLDSEPARLRRFRRFLTINVSEFFRSPDRWRELERVILPEILTQSPAMRAWSAGCAFGPEAYSLAFLLDRLTVDQGQYLLATDVDEEMLRRARRGGPYRAEDVKHLDLETRQRCFLPASNAVDPLRWRIAFRRHDLLNDEYEAGFDLIICRHVLMYFESGAKAQVARRLAAALRPGGWLFAASGEAVDQLTDAGLRLVSPGFFRKLPCQ